MAADTELRPSHDNLGVRVQSDYVGLGAAITAVCDIDPETIGSGHELIEALGSIPERMATYLGGVAADVESGTSLRTLIGKLGVAEDVEFSAHVTTGGVLYMACMSISQATSPRYADIENGVNLPSRAELEKLADQEHEESWALPVRQAWRFLGGRTEVHFPFDKRSRIPAQTSPREYLAVVQDLLVDFDEVVRRRDAAV